MIRKQSKGPGDDNTLMGLCSSYEEYADHYKGVKNEKAIGDISPSYLHHSGCAKKIKQTLGNVKNICILRNPVEKAYSQYNHQVKVGLEKLSFKKALEQEGQRRQDRWGDICQYAGSSLYSDHLREFIHTFGRQNVKVILFDEFTGDTDRVMKELFGFLGVDNGFACDTSTVFNRSGKQRSKLAADFFNKPNPLKSIAKKLIPDFIRLKLRVLLTDLNTGQKEPINDSALKYLNNFFREDIAELEGIINRKTGWLNG